MVKLMSKILTLLIVIAALLYVFLLQRFRIAPPANAINQQYRPFFLHSQIFRKLFFLDRPGDNRFVYFSPQKTTLVVEVDYQVQRMPDKELESWIKDLAFDTLGRDEVEVQVSEESRIEDVDEFSDKALRTIERNTRNLSPHGDESYLHVVYVSRSSAFPSNTGLTLTADAIFLFREAIWELSERSSARALVEESTLRHEFGHLLGLEHVDRPDCAMSEWVEVYGNKRFQFDNIPLEFCEESLMQLRKFKDELW